MNLLVRSGVLAALVAAFLVAGCGGTVLDPSKAEDQIKASAEEKRHEDVSSVDCPSDVEVEPMTKFTCTVHLSNGNTETATLLIRDEDANLNFVRLQPDK